MDTFSTNFTLDLIINSNHGNTTAHCNDWNTSAGVSSDCRITSTSSSILQTAQNITLPSIGSTHKYILLVFYLSTFCVGFLGNSLVIFIITRYVNEMFLENGSFEAPLSGFCPSAMSMVQYLSTFQCTFSIGILEYSLFYHHTLCVMN